jgi:hypothetical protein
MADSVDIYKATRTIMRLMSGAPVTARFHDLVGDVVFDLALMVLGQAIGSPDVEMSVVDSGSRREIARYERGYRLNFWTGELSEPFVASAGRPPLRNLLICAGDLNRFVTPIAKAASGPPKQRRETAPEARARKIEAMFPDGARRPKREAIAASLGVDPRTIDRAISAGKAKSKK